MSHRRSSFSHTSFGDDTKLVRPLGIEGIDVRTPSSGRFLLDGAESVAAASSLCANVTFVEEVHSNHLDVKAFVTESTSNSDFPNSCIRND